MANKSNSAIPDMSEEEVDDLFQMLEDDEFYARCPHCGHEQEVEPDADYPCPECKVGRLVSPLRAAGMI